MLARKCVSKSARLASFAVVIKRSVPPSRSFLRLLPRRHPSCACQTRKDLTTQTAPPDTAEDKKEPDLDEIKSKILDHALNHVTVHGWSRQAISQGCEDIGYPSVSEGMFENEGADLVMHFVKQSNQILVNHLQEKLEKQKESGEKLNVNSFVRDAIEFRLRLIIPYMDVWAEAMLLLLSPKMLGESSSELGHMIDDVWYLAGDRSSDFNWYTKRGLLAKLYGSTQLYMLRDQSPDFQDTWSFLDRR